MGAERLEPSTKVTLLDAPRDAKSRKRGTQLDFKCDAKVQKTVTQTDPNSDAKCHRNIIIAKPGRLPKRASALDLAG